MSPVPAPAPVSGDIFVVGTPSDGDTAVWNASSGQWEPGAGGGVTPATVFEALLPLGKIAGSGGSGGVPTLFDPANAAWTDEFWMSFDFAARAIKLGFQQSSRSLTFGVNNSSARVVATATNGGTAELLADALGGYLFASLGTTQTDPLLVLMDNPQENNLFAVTATGAIEMPEQSAPAAPAANNLRIYAKDVGGKTGLYVLFPSGAEQQIKVEA